jgi:hypothetical protein
LPNYDKLRKSLSREDFSKALGYFPKVDERFSELQDYSLMLISHLNWENREDYYELIEKFLNSPISFLALKKNMKLFTRQ